MIGFCVGIMFERRLRRTARYIDMHEIPRREREPAPQNSRNTIPPQLTLRASGLRIRAGN